MYIKASGTALKDMTKKEGWRRIRLDTVLSVIRDKQLAKLDAGTREPEVVDRLLLACDDDVKTGARPSVESHLHAFLDKCVIHLHPIAVGAYVNAKNGKAELEKLFARENFPPLWVPYTDPGFTLATKIANLVDDYQKQYGKKPAVMILEKHGLFVTAGTAEAALRLVRKVIKLCISKLKFDARCSMLDARSKNRESRIKNQVAAAKSAIRKAVFDATGQDVPVSYFSTTGPVAAFMARKDAEKLLATPALNPDELVYANGSAMWVEKCDVNTITRKLRALVKGGQKPAAAFIIKGLGIFVAADKKTAPIIAEITEGSLRIRMWATKFGGILALTRREQDFINNWEAEAFRKKVAGGQT